MLIEYMRVSAADDRQPVDLQRDALIDCMVARVSPLDLDVGIQECSIARRRL